MQSNSALSACTVIRDLAAGYCRSSVRSESRHGRDAQVDPAIMRVPHIVLHRQAAQAVHDAIAPVHVRDVPVRPVVRNFRKERAAREADRGVQRRAASAQHRRPRPYPLRCLQQGPNRRALSLKRIVLPS